jgi:hypothetical protein
MTRSYGASTIKRRRLRRATQAEMQERAEFLIDYAREHGPITVRGLYYQAEVAGVPGIDKTETSYRKVQSQVLNLRRSGDLAYEYIADATRWMRKPKSYDSVTDALEQTTRFYRRNLWRDTKDYVEVWCEKDALAGVIFPVTQMYDVPLMVTRGFSSETFAYEAVAARGDDGRDYWVYYFGDFDRSGRDAANSLKEKLDRFAEDAFIIPDNGDVDYLSLRTVRVKFIQAAITLEQIKQHDLPTRDHKRESAADKKWPYDFACELDAFPPDTLRELVTLCIERHLPKDQLDILKVAEQSEREGLQKLIRKMRKAKAA